MEHYFIAMVSSFSDFHASVNGFTSEDESLQVFNAVGSSFIKPSTNWLDELSNLPSDWALLPLNGNKVRFNPITNNLMKGPVQKNSFSRSLIVLLMLYHHRLLRWLDKLLDSLELVFELVQFHLNFFNFPFA